MSSWFNRLKIRRLKSRINLWIGFISNLSWVAGREEKEHAYSEEQIVVAREWANDANHIFLHTGAGMSVASGIGTFRGKYGLWGLYRRVLWRCFLLCLALIAFSFFFFVKSNLSRILVILAGISFLVLIGVLSFVLTGVVSTGKGWKTFPRLSWFVYGIFFLAPVQKARLNDGHKAIIRFRENNPKIKSLSVHTSNVDGLEAKMGQDYISFNHGNVRNLICQTPNCRTILELHDKNDNAEEDAENKVYLQDISRIFPQYCRKCNEPLRPSCIFFMDGNGRGGHLGVKPRFGSNEKSIHFIIGSSGLIPLGVSGWRMQYPGKVIEINIMEPDNSIHRGHVIYKSKKDEDIDGDQDESYLWIQGKQEIVLPQILQILDEKKEN